jgi:hypothetical protein
MSPTIPAVSVPGYVPIYRKAPYSVSDTGGLKEILRSLGFHVRPGNRHLPRREPFVDPSLSPARRKACAFTARMGPVCQGTIKTIAAKII